MKNTTTKSQDSTTRGGIDAITLLKTDHRNVEKLFKQFEKLGDGSGKEKKAIVQQICRELAMHAVIEEQLFYPAVRNAVKDAEDVVLESLEEHHVVKWTCSELEKMSVNDERFDAKVNVLMESVRHHIQEEEEELMPKAQRKLGREQLEALGQALMQAKKIAPTHAHPRAPDTPPGNLIAGLPAALLDRITDMVKGVAKRSQARKATASGRGAIGARTNGRTESRVTSGNGRRKAPGARVRSTGVSARAH